MKAKQTYLKGKSVFIVSLIVIGITVLTVYLSGINYNRSLTSNLYISLGIIAIALFLFMTFGLYQGVALIDNFPKFKKYKSGDYIPQIDGIPDFPDIDIDDGFGGILLAIILWVLMTLIIILLLIVLDAFFWFSIFIILTMLYWVFFRALKLVFSLSKETKKNIRGSIFYSFIYTLLYVGWIFGIVYLVEIIK